MVNADKTKIFEVPSNLLTNFVKFLDKEEKVTILFDLKSSDKGMLHLGIRFPKYPTIML